MAWKLRLAQRNAGNHPIGVERLCKLACKWNMQ